MTYKIRKKKKKKTLDFQPLETNCSYGFLYESKVMLEDMTTGGLKD